MTKEKRKKECYVSLKHLSSLPLVLIGHIEREEKRQRIGLFLLYFRCLYDKQHKNGKILMNKKLLFKYIAQERKKRKEQVFISLKLFLCDKYFDLMILI